MASDTMHPPAAPARSKWVKHSVATSIARVISIAVDTVRFAEHSLGPLLDLFIRLWLAQSFFASGLVKAASWQTALLLATYEYPVSWLDPHTSAVIDLAIELICPPLIAIGLFTRIAAIPLLILSLAIQFAYKPLPENLFWALLFGMMILRGAGALSLDRLFGPAALSSALPFAGTARRVLEAVDRAGRLVVPLALRLFMATFLGASAPVGAVLLAGGLATRLVAAALFVMVAVVGMRGAGPPELVYWLMVLGLICLHGAGPLALDELAYQRLRGLFQPLLYQVATASLSPADIATPIRTLLRQQFNAAVHYGRVIGIDRQAKAVVLDDRRIPYDYLVLATGA